MARVTYTYPCGNKITNSVNVEAHEDSSATFDGQRPIQISIKGTVSPEFLYGFALMCMNPSKRSLKYKGKEWCNE